MKIKKSKIRSTFPPPTNRASYEDYLTIIAIFMWLILIAFIFFGCDTEQISCNFDKPRYKGSIIQTQNPDCIWVDFVDCAPEMECCSSKDGAFCSEIGECND